MSMRDTSYSALVELEASGKAQSRRAQILRAVLSINHAVSRRELAGMTGLELCTVTGRVNELLKARAIAETDSLIVCPITGKRVHGVIPVGTQVQPELFPEGLAA